MLLPYPLIWFPNVAYNVALAGQPGAMPRVQAGLPPTGWPAVDFYSLRLRLPIGHRRRPPRPGAPSNSISGDVQPAQVRWALPEGLVIPRESQLFRVAQNEQSVRKKFFWQVLRLEPQNGAKPTEIDLRSWVYEER